MPTLYVYPAAATNMKAEKPETQLDKPASTHGTCPPALK
jgi:hypothetical protein